MSVQDLGPLDWRIAITDSNGRPTSEFQRRWNTQRNNNNGFGTVKSVGLSTPGVLFSVSGSPVTDSGTISLSLLNQNANKVFCGPSSGVSANPSFRSLVPTDLPIATKTSLGAVQVDGTTIAVSPSGVVSATGVLNNQLIINQGGNPTPSINNASARPIMIVGTSVAGGGTLAFCEIAGTVPRIAGFVQGGTYAAPSTISGGVGGLACGMAGYDGTAWSGNQAQILFSADNTWTTSDHSTTLDLMTTPRGSVNAINNFSIVNGNYIFGNRTSPTALATTATDGFLYLPSMAGRPSSTPTSYSPLCPIVFDTTDNTLYVYNPTSSSWSPSSSSSVFTSSTQGLTPASGGGTTNFLRADGTWAAPAGGGGGSGNAPAIRGSGIQSSSAASYTVTWPSGTVVGDLVIIFVGHGFSVNNPPGWTIIDNEAGTNWNGAILARAMNATDISTGHVTITTAGTFNGVLGVVSFVGTPRTMSLMVAIRSGNNDATQELISPTKQLTSDMIVAFGSNRTANAPTVSGAGTQLQQINGANASGVLAGGYPAASGITDAIFTYPSGNNGDYQALLRLTS